MINKLTIRFVGCILLYFTIVNAYYSELYAQSSVEDQNSLLISNGGSRIPDYASRIINAYPLQHLEYIDNKIVFPNGTMIVFDDGKTKSFESMLNDADIEDMFKIPYRVEISEPLYLEDSGRIRCEAFFKAMYGSTPQEVRKNLVSVSWFGQKIQFSAVNGAADALKRVAEDIEKNHPELKKYMKSSGTYYWRKVRHADRLSAHSYGIAIDIAVKYSNYWKWTAPNADELAVIPYVNRIPMEIVSIFERHGFVWGGRWYHFDTMHFEYRPEIVI